MGKAFYLLVRHQATSSFLSHLPHHIKKKVEDLADLSIADYAKELPGVTDAIVIQGEKHRVLYVVKGTIDPFRDALKDLFAAGAEVKPCPKIPHTP